MNPSQNIGARRLAPLLAFGGALLCALAGCGGGGGSTSSTGSTGGRGPIPPASPPVCKNIEAAPPVAQGPVGGGSASIFIPPSSVPRAGDAGLRVHTNHLILMRSISTLSNGPTGMTPSQLRTAYDVPSNAGSGAIALIEAYNYPTAVNDFNVFASTFGLPTEPSSNPTASSNAVLQVVYATGIQPRDDGSWSQEMALDSQWAHAMAPRAKIYLVEAASDNLSDIMTAIGVAAKLPEVKQVGISFGSTEAACAFVQYDGVFQKSSATFFAAAGDTSGELDYPALSEYVVAVGGTTLNVAADGTWLSETAWNSTGGGPSAFEPRPVFQDVVETITGGYRAACDIAADGDPNTGLSVYDSFKYQGIVGWQVYGGTSASTPVIAGIANAAGVSRSGSQAQNAAFYAALGSGKFHDVSSGQSGAYSATAGYDFLTGVGTPNGVGGF